MTAILAFSLALCACAALAQGAARAGRVPAQDTAVEGLRREIRALRQRTARLEARQDAAERAAAALRGEVSALRERSDLLGREAAELRGRVYLLAGGLGLLALAGLLAAMVGVRRSRTIRRLAALSAGRRSGLLQRLATAESSLRSLRDSARRIDPAARNPEEA